MTIFGEIIFTAIALLLFLFVFTPMSTTSGHPEILFFLIGYAISFFGVINKYIGELEGWSDHYLYAFTVIATLLVPIYILKLKSSWNRLDVID